MPLTVRMGKDAEGRPHQKHHRHGAAAHGLRPGFFFTSTHTPSVPSAYYVGSFCHCTLRSYGLNPISRISMGLCEFLVTMGKRRQEDATNVRVQLRPGRKVSGANPNQLGPQAPSLHPSLG